MLGGSSVKFQKGEVRGKGEERLLSRNRR